jgi:hypothetical protein
MLTNRPILSIALAGHLAALTVSAIPSPGELRSAAGTQESVDDSLSNRIRPVLDISAGVLTNIAERAWQITAPVRPALNRYSGTLGLPQTWNMFANPPTGSEYLRFRYYYYSSRESQAARPLVVATELVFPVAPDTESHLIEAYWQGHRDKAVSNALIDYFRQRSNRVAAGLPPPAAGDPKFDELLKESFLPVVQYFRQQYADAHFDARDQLIRTEVWYGFAPSRSIGDPPLSPRARATALARYYNAPPARLASEPAFRSMDALEHEVDIQWMLIYIETR